LIISGSLSPLETGVGMAGGKEKSEQYGRNALQLVHAGICKTISLAAASNKAALFAGLQPA
jgi:hypothetical protein